MSQFYRVDPNGKFSRSAVLHMPQSFSIRPRASVELFPSLANFIEVAGHILTHESTQKFLIYQYIHHSWAGWAASVQPSRSASARDLRFWRSAMDLYAVCSEMRKSIGDNFKRWILSLKFPLTISWGQSQDWIESAVVERGGISLWYSTFMENHLRAIHWVEDDDHGRVIYIISTEEVVKIK